MQTKQEVEWWNQPCPTCGKPRAASACRDPFHWEHCDDRHVLVVRGIIDRIAQNGPPRFYAGDWPGDTARRIINALSDAGFEVVERATGPDSGATQ